MSAFGLFSFGRRAVRRAARFMDIAADGAFPDFFKT